MCWVMSLHASAILVLLQIPSGNLGMFGNSGAAQARTMQQPQQPPVQPLNSSQPSLRAQVPQFLSPQVRQHFTHKFSLSLELFHTHSPLLRFAATAAWLCPCYLFTYCMAEVVSHVYYVHYLWGHILTFLFANSGVSEEFVLISFSINEPLSSVIKITLHIFG